MKWREFAKKLLLDDGRITEREAELVRRAVLTDGVVTHEEVAFLIEVKRAAVSVHPDYDEFLFRVLKKVVLRDGVVREREADWLRKVLLADNQAGEAEARFLEDVRREATKTGPKFKALCLECLGLDASHFGTR